MSMIDQREKTIVFCASQAHAAAVRDLINQNKTSTNPNYCVRVTASDGALGDQNLREFQDNEKTTPTILTTSQKLTTGVDARNVRNVVLLRPVNSMIEFKQIIGRGTRLYDGKDYFTIYDFVKAHHLFSDPEWDGEPIEPDTPKSQKDYPPTSPTPVPAGEEKPDRELPKRVVIKLADGKARTIRSMSATSYWAGGKLVSAAQFMEILFGALPEFFKDEDELRQLWSVPETRKQLLQGLAEKGFGSEQLADMQKAIDAENSDLFDVLANIRFAVYPTSRAERADKARTQLSHDFNDKQQAFLDFVLSQYVSQGVNVLDDTQIKSLIELKYGGLSEAMGSLGNPAEIRQAFVGFQKYIYQ
jgi:type I restriction enzyme R subunit